MHPLPSRWIVAFEGSWDMQEEPREADKNMGWDSSGQDWIQCWGHSIQERARWRGVSRHTHSCRRLPVARWRHGISLTSCLGEQSRVPPPLLACLVAFLCLHTALPQEEDDRLEAGTPLGYRDGGAGGPPSMANASSLSSCAHCQRAGGAACSTITLATSLQPLFSSSLGKHRRQPNKRVMGWLCSALLGNR